MSMKIVNTNSKLFTCILHLQIVEFAGYEYPILYFESNDYLRKAT